MLQPTTRTAAIALALHVLLSHIGKDPDGFVFRNLPSRLQHLFRHHSKRPANAAVDLATSRSSCRLGTAAGSGRAAPQSDSAVGPMNSVMRAW